MAPAFYERPGLNVETYDVRSRRADVSFFVEEAMRSGGPVLDLACGTGRVTWAIGAAGVVVTGIDRSVAMLSAAEKKRSTMDAATSARVRFMEGDITSFELGTVFSLVICPFRSFQMLLTVGQQQACLGTVFRHLQPGGRFILDVFDPLLDLLIPGGALARTSMRIGDPVRHPLTGNDVVVEALERTNDPLTQTFTERHRFRELEPNGRIAREEFETLSMRWTYRYEMRHLLELSGFEVEAEYSDYEGSPPVYGAEQVWVTRRPG